VLKRFLSAAPIRKARISRFAAPGLFALAGLVSQPSVVAHADIGSLLLGRASDKDSWRSFAVAAPAGSIHQEELVFSDAKLPRSEQKTRGIVLADGRRVALSPEEKPVPDTPDEARITRHLKKSRLLAVDRMQPPRDFTAGSILDRRASLLDPSLMESKVTVFARPRLEGKPLEIALAFHESKPKVRDFGVPVMLADLVTSDTADSLATAYANPEPDYAEQSPFDSILTEQVEKRFVPPVGSKDHAWAANVLPASVFSAKEQKCLATAIYFESANEPLRGQAAVAQVVLNRVRNPTFPSSICGVVYQNEDWRNRCQFSFACDRIPDIVWSTSKYKVAQQVALAVTAGKIYLDDVGDATHYHAAYVKPAWGPTMIRVSRIGLHIFYRTHNGGWT
jgi:spore germination cell wall hydrolase CwlJ-like protein